MKTKHTQGPWLIDDRGRNAITRYRIYSGSGGSIAGVDLTSGSDAGSAEANARVIAAAPELLDCMRSLLWRFDLVGEDAEDSAVVKALAVLAKIEGVRP